jgi:hypothetical protein
MVLPNVATGKLRERGDRGAKRSSAMSWRRGLVRRVGVKPVVFMFARGHAQGVAACLRGGGGFARKLARINASVHFLNHPFFSSITNHT